LKPERNRQIDGVFQAALERNSAERGAFLDEACAGDTALRKEVEALLASYEQSAGFIESPAIEIAPELVADDQTTTLVGETIGPYHIEAQLGRGGMGEVFLAQDSRLRRKVALKFLPAFFTTDKGRLHRFEQEAHATSALNHPNILTIYELGRFNEKHFIATEFVNGETLRQRLLGGRMRIDAALKVANQIGSALAASHEAGVVHRDIKPENIMVRRDEIVKVLDFGLAKLVTPPVEDPEAKTRTLLKTEPGTVMGTAQYMSPEQARGLDVDSRTDIWSLGVILYEMVCGKSPFAGPTPSDVLVAILDREPSIPNQIELELTPEFWRIVKKSLRKDREERYQTIQDLLIDLRSLENEMDFAGKMRSSKPAELSSGLIDAVSGGRPVEKGRRSLRVLLIAALLIGLTALAGYMMRTKRNVAVTSPSPSIQSSEQHLISTFSGSHRAASFSPDGRMIAFIDAGNGASPQVWVKDLTEGEPKQITSGEDSADRPRWSPRNDQIVYTRRSLGTNSIWAVPPAGGASHKVIEGGRNPNWSWDGAQLIFERGYDIWTANADGGDQRKVEGVPPTDHLSADRMPAFSPDGALIAFFQKSKGPHGDYWVVPSASGQARRLTSDDSFGGAPAWTPDGRFIVFPSQRAGSLTLWKVPAVGGEPEPILVGTGEDTDPEISRDGRRLIYTNTRNNFLLTLTDPATGRQQELHQSRSDVVDPSFSPKGDKIVFFGLAEGGGIHVYVVNADGTGLNQLTRGKGEQNVHPQWSADGSAIYFYQHKPTTSFRKISLQDGSITELARGWEWSTHNHARVNPEGTRVIYTRLDKGQPAATMIRDVTTGGETAFTQLLRFVRWSGDGRFVAGTKIKGEWTEAEITVCTVAGEGCRALTKGYLPNWSRDGKLIYFFKMTSLRNGEELWAISPDGVGEKKIVDLRPIHPIGQFYDVSATGQIIWVQYRVGKHELWLRDLPAS
jgi:eukaryotic-like serine/threonine-protein kinase